MTSPPASPPALTLEGLTKRYPPDLLAVEGVSLSLAEGEILGLLGPSGCGKTTLLRLIAGFEQADSGSLYLGGQAITDPLAWPPERRDVGIVFQDYALFPHLTVAQNIGFGLQALQRRGQLSSGEVTQQTAAALTLVGLQGLEHRFPHQLSGGQQQRVALARALAPRPRLILLDEPFSNLDVQVRVYLRQEVRSILHQVQAAGVFVTHDQEEALAMADRLAVMRQGRLQQCDRPEQVYRRPANRFVAEFVCQANFLPAHFRAGGWQTEVGEFAPLEGSSPGMEDRADVMIRQEDLDLVADEQGPLRVGDRQFLGREYRYYLLTPSGQALYARLPARQTLAPGQRVRLQVNPDQVQVYPRPARDRTEASQGR
jgi:iron(III) transport system ATP-binding protein